MYNLFKSAMGKVDIQNLIVFLFPFMLAYCVWLHNMVIKARTDIAVNTSKDRDILSRITRIEDKLDRLIEIETK